MADHAQPLRPAPPPRPVFLQRRARALAVTLVVVLVLAGCSSQPSATHPPLSATRPKVSALPAIRPPGPISWIPCPGEQGIECGSIQVPVDYRHPEGPQLTIAVSRAPATDQAHKIGTLMFNPGGPGESGNQLLPIVLASFPAKVRQRFDIVTFDPRGTGASDPLSCRTSAAQVAALDPVPAIAGAPLPGTTVFAAMARSCVGRFPGLTPYIDTTNTARDMDRIRQALGVRTVSYYGLSYGTVLGAVYAELFPHRIRTMVLDGAVDVNASLSVQADEQAPAAEASLVHLLTTCGGVVPCPLGSNPTAYFEQLATKLTRHPLPAPGHGDNVPVTVGDLDTATLLALSLPVDDPTFLKALVAAAKGNGTPLRDQSLALMTDINGASLVDPMWAITCNDAASHPDPLAAGNLARALATRYPLIGGYSSTYNLGGCVAWPAARQPVKDVHPIGAPPTLVIGNTGDPNTPLVGARHLAAAFPAATQLTWKGWGHTWLLNGPTDRCMSRYVSRYLVTGVLPPDGSVCS